MIVTDINITLVTSDNENATIQILQSAASFV